MSGIELTGRKAAVGWNDSAAEPLVGGSQEYGSAAENVERLSQQSKFRKGPALFAHLPYNRPEQNGTSLV